MTTPAVLLHYGLPPSKDKNTAKVRLLQAINANTLSVPDHIAKLEKDMKKEFTTATRKAKAAEKAPAAPSKGKKRTHEEATTNTKTTLTIDGVSITVDRQTAASITSAVVGASPAAKKARVTKDSAAPAKPRQIKDPAPAAKPKKSAQNTDTAKSKPSATTKGPVKKTAATKAQAKTAEAKPQDKVVPAKSKATPKLKDSSTATKPKAEPKAKIPAEEKPPHTKSKSVRDIKVTYLLHLRSYSPDDVPEFNGPPRISIHHDNYTNKLWGHFTIGSKTGVIRADNFFTDGFSDSKSNWRARDMGSGQLRFGRGCEGVMEFGIYGVDKGTFYRLFDGLDVDFGVSSFRKPAEDESSQPRFRTKQTARKK
ncbi:unnamed protein product [Aureobasidium vineae]|uniref:Uncharacterized protein n=1 Tax=Aureobasidium vineae TaxID=2773715 RepID=A0A9N8J6P3_9PEZI|nr:unnamed protein product [Aureobasidium vineae]